MIGRDRSQVIEKYRIYILSKPELLKDLYLLKGKVLGCWCSPTFRECKGEYVRGTL